MQNSVIKLTIEKAEALLALNPGGTSNPYITATIGAQSVTTPVQNKTVNPVFNATFTFTDCPLPSIVTLRAFNKIQYVDVEDPLGTATVTLFDVQPEETTKTVQLSHGGNAALAQRAPNGCGSVQIRYTVTPMPEAATAEHPPMLVSKNASVTSAGGASTPMPVPAAINIDASAPAAMPVAISPKDSRISTPRSGARSTSTANLVASNPSVTNPAATTPMLRPVEVSGSAPLGSGGAGAAAAVVPVYSSSAAFGGIGGQNSQLTPPSLTPAKPPAVSTFLVPQVAPPPPATTGMNMSLNTAPNNGYTSYAVPGVRIPAPVAELDAAAAAAAPVAVSAESYYANNSACQPASTPLPAVNAPSPNSASMLPVAPSAVAAVRFASLQETTNAATSFDAQYSAKALQSASASSLFTAAAQAPLLLPQQKFLSVPPNIHGTPLSNVQSREGSRLPSAAQLPPPSVAVAGGAFPAQALPAALEAGANPVAVAPRTPPLSSSTSNSRRSTPSTLSSHGRPTLFSAAAGAAAEFPAQASLNAPGGQGMRRGVAPVPATAGVPLQQQHRPNVGGSAFPSPPHRTRFSVPSTSASAPAAALDGTRSPKRRSPKNEAPSDAAVPSAEALYADPDYLFEAAASGMDEAIFRQLRDVDPYLTNGFLTCLDYSGRSLLHIAAWNGQLRVMQILLAPEPAAPMIDLRALVAAKSGNTILARRGLQRAGGGGAVVALLAPVGRSAAAVDAQRTRHDGG
ncbi:hypothetical protein ABB37_01936 [Leptomonas pyrrhocoris]|uniref:C2 domain-containing protein n=1 Tax=Leptomonas pyrrhocoris TaxID=157538 RepID=A0A0N0VGQ5_LEPPY|nr:hypothetical protein ABB37_01936 [Leptomonas pyrrhocoris]KPA83678.1 hypothetical protein ABB37_01936 [Leptomonas pyrrhocoris]|eukprot:XP_015662117.1 hypothetical protein ABB37_01936 [Leptomonas pyrrhocoris]